MHTTTLIFIFATILAVLINYIAQPPFNLKPKVFVIGLSKTGTTSIGDALALIGYKRLGWKDIRSRALVHSYAHGDLSALISQTHYYDAFEDLPWPAVYQEMAVLYPTAKFVLSQRRDEHVWLRSMRRHMARGAWDGYAYFYGTRRGEADDATLLAAYRNHTAGVREFFAAQPARLVELVIDDAGEQNWQALCSAADCRGRQQGLEFPRSNTAAMWKMGWIGDGLRWLWGWGLTRTEEMVVRWYYGREASLLKWLLGGTWTAVSMVEQACSELYYRAGAART
nr:hypothetical protein CFP56_11300 [Quercus suber]